MNAPEKVFGGLSLEDGAMTLRNGRLLAWRWWGERGTTPVFRVQGVPASRLQLSPDSRVRELGVRYLIADRPGFGGSTRKPGRGIADVADDYVELLDAHGISSIAVAGGSGGGPHALAFAARHPERVSAVSIFSGATPPGPGDVVRGWHEMFEESLKLREWMLSDGPTSALPPNAPPVMRTPEFQKMARENVDEALRHGVEGWTDEVFALEHEWDFDLADVQASVTWWHGDEDTLVSLTDAQTAVAKMPHAEMRVWHGEGHFAFLDHENEILQDLLKRA